MKSRSKRVLNKELTHEGKVLKIHSDAHLIFRGAKSFSLLES